MLITIFYYTDEFCKFFSKEADKNLLYEKQINVTWGKNYFVAEEVLSRQPSEYLKIICLSNIVVRFEKNSEFAFDIIALYK